MKRLKETVTIPGSALEGQYPGMLREMHKLSKFHPDSWKTQIEWERLGGGSTGDGLMSLKDSKSIRQILQTSDC